VEDVEGGASAGLKTADDVIEKVRQTVAGPSEEESKVTNLAQTSSNVPHLEQGDHSVVGAVVAGSMIGGVLTAGVMYWFVMRNKHNGYEQIRQFE